MFSRKAFLGHSTAASLFRGRHIGPGNRDLLRRSLSASAGTMAAGQGDGGKRFFLNQGSINPHLKKVEYAVRGPVLDRAMEIDRDLAKVCRIACLYTRS